MPPSPLPASTPSRHAVDAAGIAAFLDATAGAGIELHSLMILRHGEVIAAGWWHPYGPDRVHHLYSLSKSFTSTAAGLAAGEGLLDLDATVLSYFPELDAEVTDPRSRSMLVRHIASMASGHRSDTWLPVLRTDPDHPVRAFLQIPPDEDPGTVFAYNQSCTYTLATIIQRVTGRGLTDYLRPRLLDPIGIGDASWQTMPPGQAIGYAGLFVTTDAIARLGELYLRGGQWQGRPVLPDGWAAQATRRHVANGSDPDSDWAQGYGLQFWRSRHGYRGDGAFGQFCLVLPEQDAVIATTAATEDMQGVLDAAWAHLLPAFAPDGSPAGSAAADAALAGRVAGLELPARDRGTAAWPGEPADLKPDGGSCEALPALRRVRVAAGQLTLDGGELQLQLPVGAGRWHVTEGPVPVAVSGGWPDPETFQADVIFLETPHRLTLTCSPGKRTFGARWHTEPLGSLQSLRLLAAPSRCGTAL